MSRVSAAQFHQGPEPGDYAKVVRDGADVWVACTPNGLRGDLSQHDVEEHADGTISVSPSILVEQRGVASWHGHLVRGEWTAC